MTSQRPKLIDLDFPGEVLGPTAAAPSPIIPMPSQSPGPEPAAGADVRQIVDQLQQTAWEARSRLRAVEEERDALAARLVDAQRQANELRLKITDVPAMSQDREALMREARRYAQASNENQSRAAAAEKQAKDLKRQCDDLNRSLATLQRTSAPSAAPYRRTPASDDQILQLRQARDLAQTTSRELTAKLAQTQEELANLREQWENRPLPASPVVEPQDDAELASLRAQHGAAAARIKELEAELEKARQPAPAGITLPLTQAADAELAALQQQREEVLMQLEIVTKEVLGLRQQLQTRDAELQAAREAESATRSRLAEVETSIEPLRAEHEAARLSHAEALTSLAAAQKQIERIMRDRDEARDSAKAQALALETELEQCRHQIARLEAAAQAQETALAEARTAAETLAALEAERMELAARFEAQRLQTVDLAARLESAHHEVRLMSARLGEARLLAKASGNRPEESKRPLGEAILPLAPAAPAPAEPPPFDTAHALDAIRAMRRCYHSFAKAPADLSHLNELHCQIHSFAEHALGTGFHALHRLVSAFDAFIQELYHFPEQINETSLTTIPQTIEFFASLMKVRDLRQLRDSAHTTVYVVEDDALTCECITTAMEASMLRGICAQDPARAACELAGTACDLIFLDINMPGMDGFELCAEIRNLALHRDTPIIFLSGQDSPERRARATAVGGCDFLAKPFILCELTLKALVQITKAQLRMA